jgi:adenylate cyclase
MFDERPRPRVAIHCGAAVYRDGDYFGSDVNLTHRVVTRALAGEVLVTRPVFDAIGESVYLDLEPIGEVALKGVPEPTELYVATATNVRMR